MYEGRTRGKKLKYTYSDEEDIFSDDQPSRRSTRNVSNNMTPTEPSRPRYTASGRQIRSRAGGMYGEALLSGQREDSEYDEEEDEGRPQRTRTSTHPHGYSGYAVDDLEDESEAIPSDGNDSGPEWNGGDDDENDFEGDDEGDNVSGDESIVNGEPPSLVVQLRYGKGTSRGSKASDDEPPPRREAQMNGRIQVEVPLKASAPVQPASLPTPAPGQAASEIAQPAPVTTASFPAVPTIQQPSQPPPVMPATVLPSVSATQEAKPQTPANASFASAVQFPPAVSPAEMPKSNPTVESNGLNGAASNAPTSHGHELPRPQTLFTRDSNPAS